MKHMGRRRRSVLFFSPPDRKFFSNRGFYLQEDRLKLFLSFLVSSVLWVCSNLVQVPWKSLLDLKFSQNGGINEIEHISSNSNPLTSSLLIIAGDSSPSANDKAILRDLKHFVNWNESEPYLCYWVDITCDTEGNVIKIDLRISVES